MKIVFKGKSLRFMVCGALISLCAVVFIEHASAYWVWTPETKKFINPKYAVKDTPKEQYDWAMTFYEAKDYARAATEFDKLTKHYEFSEYASRAQYHVGLSYENMGKYYIAFQNYQKAIDNFPHIENMDEIIAREFNIAHIYAEKPNPKILGTDIMTSVDRAIEIYRKVVDNSPFGKLADEAQFRMGEVLKRANRYEEATIAFQKIVDDYPTSQFATKAQYEVAYCAYRASLQPAYDAGPTDRAIKIFEDFASSGAKDQKLAEEASKTMQRLKDKAAEKSMMTARFYEQQRHPKSAIIYYQDVLDRYPDSIHAAEAKAKIQELSIEDHGTGKRGIFQWFPKKAATPVAKAPEVAAQKKGWDWFGLFGKKTPPAPPVQAAGSSAAFEKTADALARESAQQAVAATSGAAAAGTQGTTAVAEPSAVSTNDAAYIPPENTLPPELEEKDALPTAYEYQDAPQSKADDPNVEVQDDDRI